MIGDSTNPREDDLSVSPENPIHKKAIDNERRIVIRCLVKVNAPVSRCFFGSKTPGIGFHAGVRHSDGTIL
jgi:hypothetical protein